MAVFGWHEWWRRLTARRTVPGGGDPDAPPPGDPPETGGPGRLDDCTLKAYAMQEAEWAEALIRVESARVDGEIRLLSTRLLLGTFCASVLLLSIAVAGRVVPTTRFDATAPLATAITGAIAAALLTSLAAGIGRVLRARADAGRPGGLSVPPAPAAEPRPEPGPGPSAAP
ncbi:MULTISPECIES: hypothetical protein [Streptomyces]|uniref:Integral membrane protein n=1 Tax=Streptomyces caniscabiei TaxID=2746961 RepID=A0ABU4MHX7_9ACTN|nr:MULTISPECIES: hypothetical protein [Streptomyces]MBE4736273.1 hypothetical protein [Streptomyces caniscabiei]MBE4755599.1 hypothetical protein [Streptomyces caniscabiei]MBE4774303.1 hypothetical protein [Streptomyces caniscabiei]MBE4785760.1 hypothetical protein [Streptomyces caniscabiei]MBE4793781.1 hypothetical protein [Streptomyces caniscabiei]